MTATQQLITVAMLILGTQITRFLPFIIFPPGRELPKFIHYLGKMLTPAAIAMLLVYCLKDITILSGNHGIPELISLAAVVGLHIWKRQMLLSITAGTAIFMVLSQFLFV